MIVVGYPKSGNTWACFLLAYCLNAEFDALDNPGVYPTRESQRRLVKGGLEHHSYEPDVGKVWKTHALHLDVGDQPVIYVLRDGRDVMVSYFFYKSAYLPGHQNPQYATLRGSLRRAAKMLIGGPRKDLDHPKTLTEFIERNAPEWSRHVDVWLERSPDFILRYEDLSARPTTTLKRLFDELGTPVESGVIAEAIGLFSFEAQSGRQAGDEVPGSFFRKGLVGDWKTRFTPDEADLFDELAGGALRRLGYVPGEGPEPAT